MANMEGTKCTCFPKQRFHHGYGNRKDQRGGWYVVVEYGGSESLE
jgi:hypothetical protein